MTGKFLHNFRDFCVIFSLLYVFVQGSLTDVTPSSLGKNAVGSIAAFGDFNADKHADIFLLLDNGKKVNVLLASAENVYQEKELINNENNDNCSMMTSVVPGDFNGDNQMDVLVTCQTPGQTDTSVFVYIYYGSQNALSVEKDPYILQDKLVDQPLVFDYNGDMIPDLLGEKSPGLRFYFIFSTEKHKVTENPAHNGSSTGHLLPLRQPQSSAFVDMDGDLNADLCIISMQTQKPHLEIWYNLEKFGLTWTGNNNFPDNIKVFGQATFADLDENGDIDMIVPMCEDDSCETSHIYVLVKQFWTKLPVNFKDHGTVWGFFPSASPGINYYTNTLRIGDFNLDGFPDVLTVLQNTSKGNTTQRAFLLYNVPCSGSECDRFSRTFHIAWDISFHDSKENALLAAFYDYQENGILDVIVTTQLQDKSKKIHLWKQTFSEDASFLKVMVLSGICYNNCPHNKQPYGVNQPGPVISYNTLDNNGDPQTCIATQLSQSAHFSLQLPFTVFGLGQTPNFIDELQVGTPTYNRSTKTKTWKSIIPNSQLVIIPYPIDYPSSWSNKLFVTPSRLVLLTGAALLGTCGFIAGIVGILQWREKVEDKKEKLQEAHKFHFDAM